MKGFIEVTVNLQKNEKRIINIKSITYVEPCSGSIRTGNCILQLTDIVTDIYGCKSLGVWETYDQIKNLLEEASLK